MIGYFGQSDVLRPMPGQNSEFMESTDPPNVITVPAQDASLISVGTNGEYCPASEPWRGVSVHPPWPARQNQNTTDRMDQLEGDLFTRFPEGVMNSINTKTTTTTTTTSATITTTNITITTITTITNTTTTTTTTIATTTTISSKS
ncbi:hypothetical protein PoB_004994600 [Plakobranchus ocellatus]|uniref:Uncharacterized protein n=1 Tax=Plakobranchus ocellatus TaxID=259542 RepID=A0AAV4BJC1_9GAST|nr:hypothetical protein PoB_004994600 [Plakobranchus ocellatus]